MSFISGRGRNCAGGLCIIWRTEGSGLPSTKGLQKLQRFPTALENAFCMQTNPTSFRHLYVWQPMRPSAISAYLMPHPTSQQDFPHTLLVTGIIITSMVTAISLRRLTTPSLPASYPAWLQPLHGNSLCCAIYQICSHKAVPLVTLPADALNITPFEGRHWAFG